MFKLEIHGGLKGLILASAASLMFGNASFGLEWGGGGEPDDPPAVACEADPQCAIDALHAAEGGEDKAAAAKAIRDAMQAAREEGNPGARPAKSRRPGD